ncbi:MAG: NAD(P)H-binding protein [Candidatus Acidiferrales bacterium]
MSRSALLVGATGAVGGFVLHGLLEDRDYSAVTVLARRDLGRKHPKLKLQVADFDLLEAQHALFAVDDVFCCLGTTLRAAGSKAAFERVDYHYVVKCAELAAQAGARQFLLVSAIGASPKALAFYSQVKGRAEEAVKQQGLRSVHILQPSLLLGPREEKRPGEHIAKLLAPALSLITQGPLAKYRPIEAEEVARRMVQYAKADQTGVHVHHLT